MIDEHLVKPMADPKRPQARQDRKMEVVQHFLEYAFVVAEYCAYSMDRYTVELPRGLEHPIPVTVIYSVERIARHLSQDFYVMSLPLPLLGKVIDKKIFRIEPFNDYEDF